MRKDRVDVRRVRRAAVVEEFVMQRSRTVQLLRDEVGLDVVHVGGSLRPFVAWLQRTDRTRWPHLLILDLPADAEALRQVGVISALRDAGMRVLILSSLRSRHTARHVISIGIDGIVSTTDSEEMFVSAAESALAGRLTITARAQTAIHGPADAPQLSRQEERALALYASGLSIADVADRIGVKQDTARKYLQRVRTKFTVAGRPARTKLDLARIAWADGYIISETERSSRAAAGDR
ncbi:helix-turn-helix transcriptional regulator [Microbacterium sp. ZW T6_19]|uniref:helix-turn-helix transcriptional regulator n=1 Tax=Microbacterium sp. ZW T6_19 TaxID=3378082 RepID=UPI003853AD2F